MSAFAWAMLVVVQACGSGASSPTDAADAAGPQDASTGAPHDAALALDVLEAAPDVLGPDSPAPGPDALAPDSSSSPSDAAGDAPVPPPGYRSFSFSNHCSFPIWVGALGNIVAPPKSCANDADCGANQACNPGPNQCAWAAPGGGGWPLDAAQSTTVIVPPAWGGRFWPRTGCSGFNASGVPACATGDCGGALQCAVGVGGTPPATLAELTVAPPPATDFYDVSNVDGSNVPLSVAPVAGTFVATPPPGTDPTYWCASPGCTSGCGALAACPWNLDATCPPELRVAVGGQYVGCRSAGQACAIDPGNATLQCAQQQDLYGCVPGGPNAVSGSCYSQGATSTCCGCPSWSPAGACQAHDPAWEPPSLPGSYAQVFKTACPTAYSFPYDDPTSTFQCQGTASENVSYTITFCP